MPERLAEIGALTLRAALPEKCNPKLPHLWDEPTMLELVYSFNGHLKRLVDRGLARAQREADGRFSYSIR